MKQSSTLFSCSVCSMNNRVHGTKKMSHVKNIHSWDQLLDLSKETLLQSFSENPVNELHDWIDKHPNVIQSPNVSDSIFSNSMFKKRNRRTCFRSQYTSYTMILHYQFLKVY